MLDTAAHYLGPLGSRARSDSAGSPSEVPGHGAHVAPDRFAADPVSSTEASERPRKLKEAMSWLRVYEDMCAN